MRATFEIFGHRVEVTTEHTTCSYGSAAVLVDGELADVSVSYQADTPPQRSALDLLADAAGVWHGPETRRKLDALADEMLGDDPSGADYDRVIAEFKIRGRAMVDAE